MRDWKDCWFGRILGSFVGEGTGQALLCTPHLSRAAPWPCSVHQSLAQQRQCSTPVSGALSQILSDQMTTRPTWGQGPGKTRGTLAKAWREYISWLYILLEFLSAEQPWNQDCYQLYLLFSIYLLSSLLLLLILIFSSWNFKYLKTDWAWSFEWAELMFCELLYADWMLL